MSVVDNLKLIKSCKEDIKQAIIDKGVDMNGVSLEGYATKISEIQTGGGSGDYLDMRTNMSTYYSTVESVVDCAFAYCITLETVNLPNCVSVSSSAFQSCYSLTSIDLPVCGHVGYYAFEDCYSLTSIDLPVCGYVGHYAFESCKTLTSIDLPVCGYVGNGVFRGCSSLTTVNSPKCSYIGASTFRSCSSLSVLDLRSTYSCVLSNSNAFSITPFASGIGSIYVHAAHLSQFQNGTNWTYFSECFVGVGDVASPLLAFDNGRVYGDTAAIYDNYRTALGITSSSVISVDLPNVLTLSTSAAFSNFSNLTEVSMEKLTSAPNYMCYRCSSLQSVNLPMCSYVGSYAFSECSSLQSVNLPMCSYVGGYAFFDCSSLQSVNLPMCSYVDVNAFFDCSSLQSVNLPMCSYVGGYAFYECNTTLDVYIGTSISKVCQAGGVQIFKRDWNTGIYLVNKIFVPMSLVDAYKSAQYWSEYASHIFGI